MHGREKSDSAIIAVKPTNNAVPTAAEPVEPRAGAKGNARQQSTHRTQGRERVTQALERVRQAARQRKKERFTALLHHISVDCLRMAFFALKRDAASGVDGLTWPTYACGLEMHPDKTLIVYCKDSNRKVSYPNTKFDFLGYEFRARGARVRARGILFTSFSPAVSARSLKAMRAHTRRLNLRNQSHLSLE